jgi:hypothetical protein
VGSSARTGRWKASADANVLSGTHSQASSFSAESTRSLPAPGAVAARNFSSDRRSNRRSLWYRQALTVTTPATCSGRVEGQRAAERQRAHHDRAAAAGKVVQRRLAGGHPVDRAGTGQVLPDGQA